MASTTFVIFLIDHRYCLSLKVIGKETFKNCFQQSGLDKNFPFLDWYLSG